MYFETLWNDFETHGSNMDFLLRHIITPLAPFYLCDHYIGDIGERSLPAANNVLVNNNVETLKEKDILFVQSHFMEQFLTEFLPKISCRFILMTGQWNPPTEQVHGLLRDPRIFRWFSQNPVIEHPKYIPFPTGIEESSLLHYVEALLQNKTREKTVTFLPAVISEMSSREERYKTLSEARFVQCLTGEQGGDTSRHWECIGLGAIPVSTMDRLYRPLFGEEVVYVDVNEAKEYDEERLPKYRCPNRDLICVSYWEAYRRDHSDLNWMLQKLGPIEKKIHICWRHKDFIHLNFSIVQNGIRKLRDLNTEYTLEISNDGEDLDNYLKKHISSKDYDLLKTRHIVEKVDLWRLLKIYHEGGVYMDVDRLCNIPLSKAISSETIRCVLPIYRDFDFAQDIMISCSKNFLHKRAIELNLERRRNGVQGICYLGPETYLNAITEMLLGTPIARGDNPTIYAELRKLIHESPYMDTYREDPPFQTILYQGPPVVFDKEEFYAHQGVGFHPG